MIGSTASALVGTSMTTHLGPKPPYCVGGTLLSGPLAPSQWLKCWNYGMNQPVPGWLTRISYDFGHDVFPVLAVLAVVVIAGIVPLARKRRGSLARP